MCPNRGTLVPFVPKWNSTSKASKLVPSKEKIGLIREAGCSVLKRPINNLTDLCEVWNERQNRDSHESQSTIPARCPVTSVSKDQVNYVDDVDQVANPTEISMHGIEIDDVTRWMLLCEPIEALIRQFSR